MFVPARFDSGVSDIIVALSEQGVMDVASSRS